MVLIVIYISALVYYALTFRSSEMSSLGWLKKKKRYIGEFYMNMWNGFSQWNPHMLLKDRLQENLNRRRSLTELMQYLIETVAPLSSLHAFTKIKLQSLRAYSQMLCADSSLPVSLQVSLSAYKNFLFCTSVWHVLASRCGRLLWGSISITLGRGF